MIRTPCRPRPPRDYGRRSGDRGWCRPGSSWAQAARSCHCETDDQDIEEAEILVCRSTDPSWAVLFSLAAGLVIDVGSPLSHGAILARELGLPCVINTRHATTQIRTGDRIRADGANVTVTVLDRISAGI